MELVKLIYSKYIILSVM